MLMAQVTVAVARNSLARTPPMGWMSWEIFRCDIDCSKDEASCISEWLYKNQTDALVEGGYLEAGYEGIHIDDCWMHKGPRPAGTAGRELVADPERFPSGMRSLGDYMHARGVSFGLYTAESPTTCAGYPASSGHEMDDASTFAAWGVDYLKVDGCGAPSYYEHGYEAMGAALEASGRDIVYSCSWPAYIGNNESVKPFEKFIMDGCNLWRNYADIQCNWGSLSSIIDHWGDYATKLAPYAAPGHWHDMDMLLIGANCISEDEERTQMAMWSILAAPMIMGNDLRRVPAASKAILLNEAAIAINQDTLGQMGLRLPSFTSKSATQIWARKLANGDVAVALYNKLGPGVIAEEGAGAPCPSWHQIRNAQLEACGGGAGDFLLRQLAATEITNLSLAGAMELCCRESTCEGFTVAAHDGFAPVYQAATLESCSGHGQSSKGAPMRSGDGTADIQVKFSDLNLFGDVLVYDIWTRTTLGSFRDSYTAKAVPLHGTAFLRLSSVAQPTFVV